MSFPRRCYRCLYRKCVTRREPDPPCIECLPNSNNTTGYAYFESCGEVPYSKCFLCILLDKNTSVCANCLLDYFDGLGLTSFSLMIGGDID